MQRIATNSNLLNTQGAPPKSAISGRSSQTITNVVSAGKTFAIPAYGSGFYLISSTGALKIRPMTGIFNEYTSGTGLDLPMENAFEGLEILNESATAVVFQLFVGFDRYVDRRLIVTDSSHPQVCYPTYSVPSSAATVDIVDKSGTEFLDANGGKWYAIQRTAIQIFNMGSINILLQKAGATAAPAAGPPITNPAVAVAYPNTTYQGCFVGNYRIRDAAALNIIVNEIYSAVANPN